jgi:hypothetical protein
MKIATDPKTVVTIAEEKTRVADLKAGMFVATRYETSGVMEV